MTWEEKELLLKDLSARLPYGVKVTDGLRTITLKVRIDTVPAALIRFMQSENLKYYLRTLSSMTEEENKEYNKQIDIDLNRIAEQIKEQCDTRTFCPENALLPQYNHIDWLNKKMFDYRGLIPMGLALEAPDDMYKND